MSPELLMYRWGQKMEPRFGRSQKLAIPKRGRRQQQRVQTDGIDAEMNALQRLPKQVGLFLPDRYYTKLRFWKSVTYNVSVNGQASARLSPSNAFDVDPSLGSTSMPGFAELSAIYSRYRVTSSSAKFELVNPSSLTPIEVILIPLNADPGPTPTATNVISWRSNTYAKSKMSPLLGGPSTVVNNRMSTEKIFGSKMTYFDDAFQSLVTTSPTNNWFWAYAIFVFTPIAPLIYANISCDIGIEFFDRTTQIA